MCSPLTGGCRDDWTWDPAAKSSDVKLQGENNRTVLFYPGWSNGTAAVRGTKPLNKTCSYWEIEVSNRLFGTSTMFGLGTRSASLSTPYFRNMLGEDSNSWGLSHKGLLWHNGISHTYCEPFQENTATVIGVLFDGLEGTIHFYKDGMDLGLAFSGLEALDERVYPMISSTAARIEMKLGKQLLRVFKLTDRCLETIARNLSTVSDVRKLPLPPKLQKDVEAWLGRFS